MSSFFWKIKIVAKCQITPPPNYSPPMPSSSAVFSTKSQLWNFVAASVSHIFCDFSTLKYHHKFDKFNKVNWFLALLTHKLCVCVCVRGERGLLLLLYKILQLLCCCTHYNSRFKLLAHILSLTHTTTTTARTLRDDVSRRCIFVVGHSKSKRQLKNKRENRATSRNNNKRNVLSINY